MLIGGYLAQKYALPSDYAGAAPGYTSDGSTWSGGFTGVFHLRETSGQHYSSTTARRRRAPCRPRTKGLRPA